MKKIHTRTKRRRGISSTSHKHTILMKGGVKKLGEKSFITEAKAKEHMKAQKLSEKEHKVVKVKKGKKFGIKKIL